MANGGPPLQSADYKDYTTFTRWMILVAVMLGTVLEVLDINIVNVAIPEMMGNLGATIDEISWVSTGYIIANVIFLPLTGWMRQRFGRRRYLSWSVFVFTLSSVCCGLSHSLNMLVFFRIVQGACGAALLSTAQATLFEIFPPGQISMAQAIFGVGLMVGTTVGPTLGGWITDRYSWPWVFFVNVPVGLASVFLIRTFMLESKFHKKVEQGVDFIGIILLAVGIGSMQFVLERGNREDWFSSNLIASMTTLAVTGLAIFVIWELRISNPVVNLRILKNRQFAAGCIYGVVLGFGLFGVLFIVPLYLQGLRGFTPAQSGWIVFPGGISSAVGIIIAGKLAKKSAKVRLAMVTFGSLGISLTMWMLHYISLDTTGEDFLMPLLVRGIAMGFLFLPLTLLSLSSLVGKDINAGTGLFNLFRQLGGSIGIAFLSTYLDHRTRLHQSNLIQNISVYNPIALERLHAIQAAFMAKGVSFMNARQMSLAVIDRSVIRQAMVMAYDDSFLIICLMFLCAMPLLFLFKPKKTVNIATATPADVH